MAFVTPIGNYLEGKTALHRLDTRVKFIVLLCYLTGIFLVNSWLGLSVFALLLLIAYLNAKIPARLAVRGLTPLIAILVFIIVANSFGFAGSNLPSAQAQAWPIFLPRWFIGGESAWAVSKALAQVFIPLFRSVGLVPAGFIRGLYMALRIILLFLATSLLTYTSSIVSLSDALVSLLRPLARFGVPTEDIAMVFSIALRFIMLTANEAERIMVAQQARGAAFDRGGLIKRARAWLPVLVPLFVKLFRRADRLAAAMETRCYRSHGRTHLRSSNLSSQVLVAGLLVSCLIVLSAVVL
jgi:energy-coupling factor transport system permease protein